MVKLFADTYALVEILKGNTAYEKYSQEELITSEFNIFELAYAMYRDFGRTDSINMLSFLRSRIEVISPEDLDYLEASKNPAMTEDLADRIWSPSYLPVSAIIRRDSMCHRLSPPFLCVSPSIHMRVECFTEANSQ